jgi:hypothetical protein
MGINAVLCRALSATVLLAPAVAAAEGEVDYRAEVCGGAHGSPAPQFSSLLDLPILFAQIAVYTLDPSQLYGPNDPWTNWYHEQDMKTALAKLATMRTILEENNLWDTYRFATPPTTYCPTNAKTTRQIDGTCNDLTKTWMGAAGTRFQRNMDPTAGFSHAETSTLMVPNPRTISRELFTRDTYKPVPFLNMLAAAWIQFNVHDWFNHTTTQQTFMNVPLAADDPFAQDGTTHMRVPMTAPDPTRKIVETSLGPTYPNEVTHWWDASQVYGSDLATSNRLRAFVGGRLKIDSNGLLPKAADGFDDTGFRNNWWAGLALMHNLFAQEHNAVAGMLQWRYPWLTDQQLYDKARMIVAAVIVKIHTLEWTPAIIPNPALEVGMNVNWYGLNKYMWPKLLVVPSYVPLPYRHVIFGIRGDKRTLHKDPATGQDVPFGLTEEFVSVYRMHTLLPDQFEVNTTGGSCRGTVQLAQSRNAGARRLLEQHGMTTMLYSFGTQHPGGLVLDNYPQLLQSLEIPFLGPLDIGAVDVLRDRERGVPRYNEFRRQLNLLPLNSIDELTDDPALRAKLKKVYGSDAGAIERVDTLVGTLAEGTRPTCYGFGETLFQVFTLMASRRMHADRFFTDAYNADTYTQAGLDWINAASMKSVLLRHHPALAPALDNVSNAFYPWQ